MTGSILTSIVAFIDASQRAGRRVVAGHVADDVLDDAAGVAHDVHG